LSGPMIVARHPRDPSQSSGLLSPGQVDTHPSSRARAYQPRNASCAGLPTTDSVSRAIRQLPVAGTHPGRHAPAWPQRWASRRSRRSRMDRHARSRRGVRRRTKPDQHQDSRIGLFPQLVCPRDLKSRRAPERGTPASPRDRASATGCRGQEVGDRK
jgi:hypothetical protein